ncbi:unnamed protein product [Prorocentrum cordatum]|uniref:Uncharacterized protein n=1 Tax=Prorocentrum cordatum TaxID=2364126 RepID=A0ABN9UA16_9DINO|nr:unnamed protein product [Polarella glacialis]
MPFLLPLEEHAADLAVAIPGGEAPEAAAPQIERLHAQVSGLGPAAARAAEVARQLQDQELASSQLLQFARDLGNAEDRVRQVREVLTEVSDTAQKMSESAAQSRKQLIENIKVLTRKLPQRGALDLSGR